MLRFLHLVIETAVEKNFLKRWQPSPGQKMFGDAVCA